MTAAAPRKPNWWHGQDSGLSSESASTNPSYLRPAVTTGASLPWGGKANSSLGPPRAIYAGHASIPTITVSSCQPGMTTFVCKQEVPSSSVPTSPFAASANNECFKNRDAVPFSVEPKTEGSGSEAAAMTHHQQTDESAPDVYSKLPSKPSGGSSSAVAANESRRPSVRGQIITTAQDEQGLAMTLGQSSHRQKDVRKFTRHNPFNQAVAHPFPKAAVVTTNSSLHPSAELRPSNLTEPEKQPPSFHSLPLDYNFSPALLEPEDAAEPRRGLRSAPLPSCRNEMRAEVDIDEELQKSDSLALDGRSTDVEVEDCTIDQEEQRRIRRRNNNRESAKRVREKRDADLKAVNSKIAKLQESQAQLLEQCTTMDSTCQQLHQELEQMRCRWENGKAENERLKAEVEHLRRNMRVGERDMAIKTEPHEDMRTSNSEIFAPTTGEMVADMGGWDHRSYDPMIDHYLTFGLSEASSLDFINPCLPETHSMM